MTTTDANKDLVRRLYTDYLDANRLDRVGDIVSPDYENGAAPGSPVRGIAAFGPIAALLAAFPDIHYTIADLIADGDRVAVRWSWTGTHTGPYRGIAPTGKQVTNTGIAFFQIAGGKLVRGWIETDRLGFTLAIGAVADNPLFHPPVAPAR